MTTSAKRAVPQLDPGQRRRLMVLTLVLAAGLLALLRLSLRGGAGWPELPALVPALQVTLRPTATRVGATPLPTFTPDPRATPIPTRSVYWWLSGTPELGEEDLTRRPPPPRSLQTEWIIYLPYVPQQEPQLGRLPATLVPEPQAVGPTPDWPDGLSRLTNSKLGIHSLNSGDPYIMEFVRRARPRVVKSVDDLGWLQEVKSASPNTLTIGRVNDNQDESMLAKDPVVAADDYIAAQLDRYRLNPGVDVWEGPNEFVPVDNARMQWYAAFEAHRVCRMQALGFRAAVGGFSVGVPEYEQMAYFMPALEAAFRCDGIFTLHEYNSPTMDCGVSSGRAGIIPGAPNFGSVEVGYHALRYRFWYEGYLKPRGLGTLPLVISEAGVEGRPQAGGPCNDPGGRAWKSYSDWWIQRGYGTEPGEAYVNVLSWYDTRLKQDSYVIGATLFTGGATHSGATWHPFDLHDAFVALAKYAVQAP